MLHDIVYTFPYVFNHVSLLFQRPKYCIMNRSRWQPICGKIKHKVCIYYFSMFQVFVHIGCISNFPHSMKRIYLFQVARCHNLYIADRLLAFRRRNRPGNFPEHILGGGGFPRGVIRRYLGAGKGLCREALGVRPEV